MQCWTRYGLWRHRTLRQIGRIHWRERGESEVAAEVTTRFLAESEYPNWADLVAAAPGGSVYSLPESFRLHVQTHERKRRIVGTISVPTCPKMLRSTE
jgi:hypothetical protein